MARLIYPLTESVLEKADLNAAKKVINSKKITMGVKTKQIENYFNKKIVKTNSLMVNSGSSANLLIFQCLINPMVKDLNPEMKYWFQLYVGLLHCGQLFKAGLK